MTPNSPAARAGLRGVGVQQDGTIVPGDIILEIEGTPVDSVARLLNRIDEQEVGDTVTLTVLRDTERRQVRVTLEAGVQ